MPSQTRDLMQHMRTILLRQDEAGMTDAQLLGRFLELRDEAAVAALLRRHGPMVWAVCRRLLSHHDAEDAFQATVLVLVRKAAAIVPRDMLANWLYGVAHQTAKKAKAMRDKRQTRERQATTMPEPSAVEQDVWNDLQPLLDEELSRLPDKYRAAIVLCDLQGKTRKEAAQQLRLSEGALAGHLTRGRAMLARRLSRRGVALSGGGLAAALTQEAASASVPASVMHSAIEAVTSAAAGQAAATGAISVKAAVLLVLAVVGVGSGGLLYRSWATEGLRVANVTENTEKQAEARAPQTKTNGARDDLERRRADRYGDPLPAGALLRLGTSRFHHDGSIYAMAYSADGRLLVTGNAGYRSLTRDASVVVWDAQSGKRIRTWYGHAHVVRSVALSHDNRLVAVVNGYGHFHLYDIATGKEPRRFTLESPGHAAFTADGRLLVTDRGKVRRWQLASGNELSPLVGAARGEIGMAATPDGKTVATYTPDGDVRIWNADGSERCRILIPTKGMVASLSRDGKQLACGTFDGSVRVFDAATGRQRWRTEPGSKNVSWRLSAAAFSPDGRQLLGSEEQLTVWDAATGKVLRQSGGLPYGTMQHAHFSPDGKRIVTAGTEAAPRFWEAATLKETLRHEGHQHAVLGVAFTADGKELATISDECFVHLWDLATGRVRRIAAGTSAIRSLALARTGTVMAISRPYEWPELWDVHSGKLLRKLRPRGDVMGGGHVQLAADGKTLAAGTGESEVRFWDAATRQESPLVCKCDIALTGGDLAHYVRFVLAPDGKTLAVTRSQQANSGVLLWDVDRGKARGALAEHGEPGAIALDGRRVAILDGQQVHVVDAASGAVLCRVQGDTVRVLCAAFSPDGGTLATAGAGGVVALWEVATGQLRGRRAGHDAAVTSIAFAPNGRRLASGSSDHTALLWDLTDGAAPGPLTAAERDVLWARLAGADAALAYQAIWRLVDDPERVVPFLKAQMRPIAQPDARRVEHWIKLLDSDHFAEREQATRQLAELNELAEAALRQAEKQSRSPEQRRRIKRLLHRLPTRTLSPEEQRQLRSIQVLEYAGTENAKLLLKALASGAPDARLTRAARAASNHFRHVP